MTTHNGKCLPECDSCINAELDPFECDTCEDGSNWEGSGDESDWLVSHEYKIFPLKESI